MSRRTDRVAQLLRAELARILHEETTDPRLRLVTVTQVRVSADLGSAQVYWSCLSGDDDQNLERVSQALERASGYLRHHLAEALPLRRAPALRFRHDPSMTLGARTLATLRGMQDGSTE